MAYLLSKQSGNWSSSSTWEVAGFTSIVVAAALSVTTAYVASSSSTPGAITMTGVWLYLYSRATTPSGTVDIQLWNSTSSVQVAIVTVNISDLPKTPVLGAGRGIFFRFSSPVILLAATSYQIRIKATSANKVAFWRTATSSTDWARIFVTSTNATPSVSDIMFIQGSYDGVGSSTDITVTMDNNNSTLYGAVMTGLKGTLDWVTNASTELRLNGEVWSASSVSLLVSAGTFKMGSTSSRIESGFTASLIIDAGVLSAKRIQVQYGEFIAAGSTMSYTWTTLDSDVSIGSTSATTSVATGWGIGSDIVISPTIRHTSTSTTIQYDRRTLTSVSGTSLGFSSLTYPHSGTGDISADVINLSRNCKIKSLVPTLRTYMLGSSLDSNINLNDVEFINFGSGQSSTGAITFNGGGASGSLYVKNCSFNDCSSGVVFTTTTNFYNCIVDNCVYSTRAATTGALVYHGSLVTTQPISINSYISNNCMIFGGTSSQAGGIILYNNAIDVENNSISGIQIASSFQYGQAITYIISGKFNNNIGRFCGNGLLLYFADSLITGYHPTGNKSIFNLGYGFYLPGITNTRINDLVAIGNSTNLLGAYSVSATTKNVIINNANIQSNSTYASAVGILLSLSTYPSRSSSVELTFNNCNIGNSESHTTADIRFSADSDQDCNLLFNNCGLGSSIEVSQPQYMSINSKVAFQRVDQVNGAHRTYYKNGLVILDTTIYRSSGKSVRLTPSTTSLQNFGLKKIPVREGTTPSISVWVRKSETSDGSDYNGTQPRLWLKNNQAIANFGTYDDIILATASGTNGVWEQLSATLPVISYEDTAFEVYLDCSGTSGWVNVDDWRVSL